VRERHGEDSQGSGRLLLFSLAYAQFAAGSVSVTGESTDHRADSTEDPAAKVKAETTEERFLSCITPKLKLVWTGPGPASAVKQLRNYVLSSVGSRLFVYQLKNNPNGEPELEHIAFFAAQFYIVRYRTKSKRFGSPK
jgi:hypothetical protein